MSSEYPSDQALRFIRKYDVLKEPIEDLVHFIIQEWWMPDWGCKFRGRHFELHTGGWSGNESLIGAAERNIMFWMMCWVKSVRGGHFYFEIPENMTLRARRRHDASK